MHMRKRILISLLFLIPIIGFSNGHGNEDTKMKLELVHRHDVRLSGVVKNHNASMDQTSAIKGFIERDAIRHEKVVTRGTQLMETKTTSYEAAVPRMKMHSGRDYGLGEYFVQVGVGTPEQRFWLVADTGNDFTWVNCIDHHAVKRHHHVHHGHRHHRRSSNTRRRKGRRSSRSDRCKGVFCPKRSSSFETVTCSSEECKGRLSNFFTLTECPYPSAPCLYNFRFVNFLVLFGILLFAANWLMGLLGKKKTLS